MEQDRGWRGLPPCPLLFLDSRWLRSQAGVRSEMLRGWLLGVRGGALIGSICPNLWCGSSHRGRPQATKVRYHAELGSGSHGGCWVNAWGSSTWLGRPARGRG